MSILFRKVGGVNSDTIFDIKDTYHRQEEKWKETGIRPDSDKTNAGGKVTWGRKAADSSDQKYRKPIQIYH